MFASTTEELLDPYNSIISISPVSGQGVSPPFSSILEPSIQNAGHKPLPSGNLILASIFPYLHVFLLAVLSLAEVYLFIP